MKYYQLQQALEAPQSVTCLVLHYPLASDLAQLNEAFRQMPTLQVLELSGISFRQLPAQIAKLNNLKKLKLSQCKIAKGPITLPPALKELSIIDCDLPHLPEWPPQLSHLQLLGKKLSPLLPEFLHRVQSPKEKVPPLEKLSLTQLGIRHLPKGLFKKFSKLKQVDLSDNLLTSLPDLPEYLPWRSLLLAHNRLRQLPELGLQELDAQHNLIKNIPKGIIQNRQTTYLNLAHNRIESLEEIKLPALQQLFLQNNRLRKWPKGLEHSKSLRRLNLNYNRLEEVPAKAPELPALQELGLAALGRHQQRPHLPEELSGFRQIRHLDLSRTALKKIPRDFGALENLRTCRGPTPFKQAVQLIRQLRKQKLIAEQGRHLPLLWAWLSEEQNGSLKLPLPLLLALASSRLPKVRKAVQKQLHLQEGKLPDELLKPGSKVLLIGRPHSSMKKLKRLLQKEKLELILQPQAFKQAQFALLGKPPYPEDNSWFSQIPLYTEKSLLKSLYQHHPLSPEEQNKLQLMLSSKDPHLQQLARRLLKSKGLDKLPK